MPLSRWLVLLALLLLAPVAHAQSVTPGQTFTARVVEVTDGDTYDVRRASGGTVPVRLHGVDAPETDQPYGAAATRAARRYVGGKRVRVTVEDIGVYGRAVAALTLQGGDLGALLLRDGLAWHYERYAPNATEYARLQRQARNGSRGLWASTPDRDCDDFATQPAAQRFFRRHQPGDPHRLDGNGDGKACESLPDGP